MKNLHIGDFTYPLPESMNEMTTDQLISLSTLVSTDMPIQEVKVKMLFYCLNAQVKKQLDDSSYKIKIGSNKFEFTNEDVTNASAAFDYLYTDPDENDQVFLDNRLTVNHYPKLIIDGIEFHSPMNALENMLYNQYIYLQTYDVMQKKKPSAIYAWLGSMFRRDMKRFNQHDLNIEQMKKIKPEVVVLTLWYWIGSCRFIADKFPRIFNGEVSNTNPYDGQQKLLNYIAKADPIKTKAYKQDTLYNILYSLDYLLEREEKQTPTT